jgi:Mn2+/Fe2+ NRAMP family transporter
VAPASGAAHVSAWELVAAAVLLLCASMYFGTGWSLALFTLPNRPHMTVDNYHDQIVGPIRRATRFFTWMTVVMIAAAAILIVGEWGSAYVIAPALVLACVVGATLVTVLALFPHNKKLRAGIQDNAELQRVLGKWIVWNWVRMLFWTGQWAAIATYFALKAR